jgi:hypothetical protein
VIGFAPTIIRGRKTAPTTAVVADMAATMDDPSQ